MHTIVAGELLSSRGDTSHVAVCPQCMVSSHIGGYFVTWSSHMLYFKVLIGDYQVKSCFKLAINAMHGSGIKPYAF